MGLFSLILTILFIFFAAQIIFAVVSFFIRIFLFTRRMRRGSPGEAPRRNEEKKSKGSKIIDAEFKDIE